LLVGNSFELISLENAGSQLEKGVILKTQDDQDPFSIYVRPELADWDGDGDSDVLLGNEDGRPTWIENLGKGKLAQERFLIQLDPDIDVGCSSVPVVRDWDADGDLDLICGNSTGYIEYFENKSNSPTEYIFNSGQRLKEENKVRLSDINRVLKFNYLLLFSFHFKKLRKKFIKLRVETP